MYGIVAAPPCSVAEATIDIAWRQEDSESLFPVEQVENLWSILA
jgi:hypothetical protein